MSYLVAGIPQFARRRGLKTETMERTIVSELAQSVVREGFLLHL